MQIMVAGISHRTAPTSDRERFALLAKDGPSLHSLLAGRAFASESLILSTCNRFELYCAGKRDSLDPSGIISAVSEMFGTAFKREQWYISTGEEALTQLFRVAAGLDAMVVGETQILSQLKMAYQSAWEEGTTGPALNRALHRAFFVAKRVHTECKVSSKPVSVASVAAAHAAGLVGDVSQARALVLGTGEMGTCAARQLVREGFASVAIAGRSPEKAAAAASSAGASPVSWNSFPTHMAETDVVIAATSSRRPVIGSGALKSLALSGRRSSINLIDLGTPRNIPLAAAKIKGMRLITMDDLKTVAENNRFVRREAAGQAEILVANEARRFFFDLSGRRFAETISALSMKMQSIGSRETNKLFRSRCDLTPEQRLAIEVACRSIISKVLQGPAKYLRDEALDEGERFVSADLLKRIFKL